MLFFYFTYGHHRDLHSFPTRRSSDLGQMIEPQVSEPMAKGTSAADTAAPAPDDEPHVQRSSPQGLCAPRSRSEEHTSELQSLTNLVCRLLLEKKKVNVRREKVSFNAI